MKKLLLAILFLSTLAPSLWGKTPLTGGQEASLFFSSNGHGEYEPCG